jgi:hypothetical protein
MMALRDYVDGGPMGKRRLPVLDAGRDEEDEESMDADADGDDADAEGEGDITEFDVEAFASGDLDND